MVEVPLFLASRIVKGKEKKMDLLLKVVLLLVGFVLLVKGADIFVEGSSGIAKILRVPSIIVGCTVVSMGTSLPELAVSTTAAISGANEIALSNVIGSNIFNFLMVLGFTALLAKEAVPVKDSVLKVEFPLNLVVTAALGVMAVDMMLTGTKIYETGNLFSSVNGNVITGSIGRIDGIILLVIFIGYMIYTVKAALKARNEVTDEDNEPALPIWKAIVFIIAGIIAIKFGGDFVVTGAKAIAAALGMSQTLIGLTIVACGTSLPELVTSVVAARKGETDLAVGNVIGSDLFNMLFILGVSTTIHPIAVISSSVADLIFALGVAIVGLIFCRTKKSVNRVEGIIMILAYAAYLVYIIIR